MFLSSLLQIIQFYITMGVPVFFKWLTLRNPKIIKDAVEVDENAFSSGNPPIDNFYIDMNGLIHPSCNPRGENIKIPTNFQQQCANIYTYIDKLMNIIRPRKTLYLAIDGVAPRAKMNQQRSRRFRAAIEGAAKVQKKLQLLEKFKQVGAWNQQIQDYATKKDFDSNMITPGTQFLCNVSMKLKQYIKDRLQNHRHWKNLTVVFSDANCPGEGQHKIMDYIRQERASSQYTPDQSHCIYGADADLIMLSLATHQPKFYIIRQVVITANDKFCSNCQKRGHFFMDCNSATSIEDEARVVREQNASSINVEFQIIRIQMVREYIHINFMRSIIPFGYDLERIIDDFVFLCFFVGNDFLPHIPCLSIREGGIDVLLKVYEYCLSVMPDYITNSGNLNMKSLKIFIQQMTYYEQSLVGQMIIRQTNNKQRQINNKISQQRQKNRTKNQEEFKSRGPSKDDDDDIIDISNPISSFKDALAKLGKEDAFDLDDYSVFNHVTYNYKQKYYREKFKISSAEFLQLKHNISKSYVQALKWICAYYYKGVPSWSWFYPFHYSPFFTDLTIPNEDIPDFDVGTPFKPFQQLMAVLPPRTCDALPTFMHFYMKSVDSPIIDYYPSNFHIDLVGKKFAWLGEVILPFIDDKRLLAAIGNYVEKLNEQQKYRNRFGCNNVFINRYGPLGRRINKVAKKGQTLELSWEKGHDIEGTFTVTDEDNDFIGFRFEQPLNREHSIKLKDGLNFNPLQEIDESFISRTDKRAFGGERYVRVVEGVMQERKSKLRKIRSQQDLESPRENRQFDKEDKRNDYNRRNYSRDSQDYERSRQKNRHYQRPYNNQQNPRSDQNRQYYHHNQRHDGAKRGY